MHIIKAAAQKYDKFFNSKNILIIFGDLHKPQFIEARGTAENFLHLCDVKLNMKININSSSHFLKRQNMKDYPKMNFDFKALKMVQQSKN